MRIVGSKNGSGVYQNIISMMPPHRCYVELFLGSGAILRKKRKAAYSFGVDMNPEVTDWKLWTDFDLRELALYTGNALDYIKDNSKLFSPETLVYADPPYLRSVRSSNQFRYYKHEFWTDDDHTALLNALQSLNCMVMISGYESALYNEILKDWRKDCFWTTNRRGKRVKETVWVNFDKPLKLHDYRFLGKDRIDRQRIKRKAEGYVKKLKNLPSQERYAIIHEIEKSFSFDQP